MPITELIKAMFHAFFVITTGVTIAMYVICLIFFPDTALSAGDLGGILLVSFLCDLSFLIFYSKKELGKKQMCIRFCIHIPVNLGIVLCFAHIFDWINLDRFHEVAVLVLFILGIYGTVIATNFYRDKKTAGQLNDKLKKRYHS